jgi:hypothetical protein
LTTIYEGAKMDKKKSLTVALSQEELYVVMAYLGANVLLGLDNAPLKELSEDQYKLVMRVAERALIAREFLIPDDNKKFKLNDAIHALIGTCAAPDKSLIIKRTYPNKLPEEYLFHLSRKMIVLHTSPLTAIRQFVALADKEAMLQAALSILELTSSGKPCPPAQLTENKLAMVREAMDNNNPEEARMLLKDSNWESVTIEFFIEALKTIVHSDTIAYVVHKSDGDGIVTGSTLLKAENGLWLLTSISDSQLEVRLTSPDQVNKYLKKLTN